ncbi:SDR family oxidoreductase [Gordonia sp. L191]|uniref:SDR family NAD(P)-dependent oxidoreductase n=1 Tax=Gordonia sp. L191 TaxID=2982699 RepID=UPI0024C0A4B0|nr:SDR family oxidoreductase [Gordonia sp. L191]WHU49307.1 SDR family oxidoreductase [Gordonia sp. L191]
MRARWVAALDKNLLSTVLPVEYLLPRVVDDRGRIVLIASTSALDGRGGPYATAKAAVAGYGRDLALRAGARGITANVVVPGFVSGTGFFEVGGYGTPNSAMLEQAAAGTLVGRVGTPRDVTHIVTKLLSVDAGWITGQLISPNGGMVLH